MATTNVQMHPAAAANAADFNFSLCVDGPESDFEDPSPCKPLRRHVRSLGGSGATKTSFSEPLFIDPFLAPSAHESWSTRPEADEAYIDPMTEASVEATFTVQAIGVPTALVDITVSPKTSPHKRAGRAAGRGSLFSEVLLKRKCAEPPRLISPKKHCVPVFEVELSGSSDSESETDADSPQRAEDQLRGARLTHRPNNSVLGIPFLRGVQRLAPLDEQGSPLLSPVRRRSSRLNGLPRRTQSLFTTPQQLLQSQITTRSPIEQRSALDLPNCPVPSFTIRQDPFRRISALTLCRAIDGEFSKLYKEIVIVDCRFEYEFEGGHISGALNVNSKQQLEQVLFQDRVCSHEAKVLLVFHCEHSAYRSPMLANHLRHCDRAMNVQDYPSLFYPDVVVLDGGYSEFYARARDRCEPRNYVGMNHEEHQLTCEREMLRFRDLMKPRKSVSLSQVSRHASEFKFPPAPQETGPGACRSASLAVLETANERLKRLD